MPCPFHCSYIVDIYDFCPLPGPDVGFSIFVCDVEHTSFHFGLCGRKFVLCLFGQCPCLCTIWHSWQHRGVVHLSLQADGKVAFTDVPVFGVCRPACHDSSLYLFVLVIFLEAVVLSQVHVALDILYQHILLLLLLTLGHVHYRVSTFATIIDHTFLSSVIYSSRPCSLMSLLILSIHLMRGLPLGLFQVFPYQAQFLSCLPAFFALYVHTN